MKYFLFVFEDLCSLTALVTTNHNCMKQSEDSSIFFFYRRKSNWFETTSHFYVASLQL